MGHQHESAWKVSKAFFENLQRSDVQIVGRLIQQQHVGGLQHEPGEKNARLLTAGQIADGQFQLFLAKKEALRPGCDVIRPAAIEHHLGIWRQGLSQRNTWVQVPAVLVERDHA